MAARTSPTALDSWIEAEMKKRHIPGMAVGVYKNGKPVEIVTRGFADIEAKVPVRRDTQFEICSITKQFTAAAVLLLEQDGKLRLDDPIGKFVKGIPPAWSDVTLRRLLNHSSGVPDRIFADHLTSLSRAAAIKKMVSHGLEYKPGNRWSYNNTGYWLLGLAIEKASGVGYFEFLESRIFRRLGMKHTFPNRAEQDVRWRARGYRYSHGAFEPANPLSDEEGYAAGGLISTVDDLNIWSRSLENDSLLTKRSREEMLAPAVLRNGVSAWNYAGGGYGLGVFVGSVNGHRVEKHSGGWDDSSCQLARFLDDGLTVVMLTNVGHYEQRSFSGERIAHLFVPAIKPPVLKASGRQRPACQPMVKAVLDGIVRRHILDKSLLGADCREKVLSQIHEISEMTGNGPLRKLDFVREIQQADAPIYLFRATFGRPLAVQVAIAKNKIVDLQVFELPTS